MGFRGVLAGIAVNNMDAAKIWYEQFFGRAPDRVPMENDAEWDFGNGSMVQVFGDSVRAGYSSMTLEPSDFEEEVCRLAALGLMPDETSDSGPFRIAIFTDPDGNQLVLAQAV